MDGGDGVVLDITGCAHLCGGEAALSRMRAPAGPGRHRRARRIAETPAAAWAWARFRREDKARPIVPEGAMGDHLAPTARRRAAHYRTSSPLPARVGLRRIADLLRLPRAPLVARYGESVTRRLDRLVGRAAEPIAPRAAPARLHLRHAFTEPIQRREDINVVTERLLGELCVNSRKAGRGARAARTAFFRVDATAQRIAVGTSAPSLDPRHLLRLFDEKFATIDAGFGVEAMGVEAVASDR